MSATGAERIRSYRARRKEQGLDDTSRKHRREHDRIFRSVKGKAERRFTGCDGEGAGVDESGRQQFLLFRMGGRELYRDGQRLETRELLDFICDHPGKEILVGFAFGYDATMILRDLPERQAKRLFEPIVFRDGYSPYVWYRDFDIQYLPKQYLKVRRVRIERDSNGKERRVVVKGSTRTIYETFGFFQKAFVKVISEFEVGTKEQRETVAENKARRSSFTEIGPEERAYCKLECELLAELMERLRGYCSAAGIVPRTWSGAGKLAGALHRLHDTVASEVVRAFLPRDLLDFAGMAYYGGRFEISRVGFLKGTVYEYDIRSAYPSAMRSLPCLVHGTWEKATGEELERYNGLFVSACAFKARDCAGAQFGGLPVRTKQGHLCWPLQGKGIYWSCEIESARRLGFAVRLSGGWAYHKCCDCKPFEWIEPLFEYRKSIGSSGPGFPIKLGINALYGLLAQRKGSGKFANIIWAGLITAITRGQINDAIRLDPGAVFMAATDAVYSLRPLGLPVGERLGDWEASELKSLFVVQPGLYWDPSKRENFWRDKSDKKKSRGLSGKFFEEPGRTESFESAWSYFQAQENSKLVTEFPSVEVPVPNFIGLKLALARNKPLTAGCWTNETRSISFDYRNKRQGHKWEDGHIITSPKRGYSGLVSLPHREFLAAGGAEPWENARLMLEEQPDWIDLGPPFED